MDNSKIREEFEARLGEVESRMAESVDKLSSKLQQVSLQLKELIDLNRISFFSTFDGTEYPLIWLHRCEKFFPIRRTVETDKVGLSAFHMTGATELWYYQMEKEEPNLSWEAFKKYYNLRFGPTVFDHPSGELIRLKQTGSVEEYLCQFEEILSRVGDSMSSNMQLYYFIEGLKDSVRKDVEMQNPTNLLQAMDLSRTFEKKQQHYFKRVSMEVLSRYESLFI